MKYEYKKVQFENKVFYFQTGVKILRDFYLPIDCYLDYGKHL